MLKIGHRGAPGNPRYGENTILSFEKAIWKGANALEFDVRRTKDGKLVVIHNLSVKRTTNGSGNVCDLTYRQLSELDAGFGEKIPLLEDVLTDFAARAFLNIHIKEDGIAEDVLKMIQFYCLRDQVLISAFDSDDNDPDEDSSWDQLKTFRGEAPIALLARESKINQMGWPVFLEEALRRQAFAIHPEHTAVYQEAIKIAHDRGLLVNVWTANDPRRIRELHEMGVDGACSDFPELL